MSAPTELVSELKLVGIDCDGAERSLTVGVGRPYQRPTGEWACPTLSPDLPDARPIYGEDSLQALCLGLSFIRRRLEHFLEEGGRLFLPDGRGELSREDLDAWFSQIGGAGSG